MDHSRNLKANSVGLYVLGFLLGMSISGLALINTIGLFMGGIMAFVLIITIVFSIFEFRKLRSRLTNVESRGQSELRPRQ